MTPKQLNDWITSVDRERTDFRSRIKALENRPQPKQKDYTKVIANLRAKITELKKNSVDKKYVAKEIAKAHAKQKKDLSRSLRIWWPFK